eukprot:CAMPEP_0202965354 /NCGR_PEP_ID=MMETSP1396-20130829/9358_1 /ASSEMBLY_ACC=CAM_ASM_000872 /TAXON_ID= /ORGANISM="Pseudokeronopsis sp., Strain Brazil" /LENGTH=63 /DNA_ID=CAMNT_0049688041 /DNA_START=1124 /DNA_END=1315 /DNA_ORIENTATION=-
MKLEGATELYPIGESIMMTSILSIIYCAPMAAVLLNTFGPVLVDKDPDPLKINPETKVEIKAH